MRFVSKTTAFALKITVYDLKPISYILTYPITKLSVTYSNDLSVAKIFLSDGYLFVWALTHYSFLQSIQNTFH